MEDLISREQAIDALRTCYDTETITMDNGDEYINYGDAVGEIEQLPPIQPRRGQWIMSNVGDTFMTDAPKIIYCSSCNVCAPYATNYCPMCGADMRGEQE